MNERDDLDRMLATWLDDPLTLPAPRYLGEVLDRTRVVRQRPAWASLERWLPMVIVQRRSSVATPAMLAVAGTILILAALAASSAIPFLAGAVGPTATTPSNGLVAFTHDGDVYVVEPSPGSVPRAIATGPDDDVSPLFSPDGRHLAFFSIGEDGEVPMLTDANGGEPRALVSDPFAYGLVWADWSPDSSALLVTTDPARPPNGATEMALLATDGSGALEPIGGRDLIPDPVTMGTVRPGSDLPLEVLFRVA